MYNNDWFINFNPNFNSTIRLFCFPYAGGGSSAFYPWKTYLANNIELIAIQYPGREGRFSEPLVSELKVITHELAKGFKPYLDNPYLIFGHSLGSLIGFEFIRLIRQLNFPLPKHFIVSGAKAPHMPLRRKHLHNLEDIAFKKELMKYNGVPEHILNNDELMNLFMPLLRNDFKITEDYVYQDLDPLSCNITALSGLDDETVLKDEVLGWGKQTNKNFQHISYPGDHFFIRNHQIHIIQVIHKIAAM